MTASTEPSLERPCKALSRFYRVEVEVQGPTLSELAPFFEYLMEYCPLSEEAALEGLVSRVGEGAMAEYQIVAEKLRQEGRVQRDRELATRLLDRGIPAPEVAELVGLDINEVEYLARGCPPAPSITLEEFKRLPPPPPR
jgi:hypothetical protein